jgi:acetylornithine deacetylase/succinyl-diaminopimelate desuccinylase-like protein
MEALDAAAGRLVKENPRVKVEWEVLGYAGPMETDADSDVVRVIRQVVGEVIGREPGDMGAPFITDGRFYDQAGTPTVLFGPGGSSEAHTTHEFVDIDALLTAARVYGATFTNFLTPS